MVKKLIKDDDDYDSEEEEMNQEYERDDGPVSLINATDILEERYKRIKEDVLKIFKGKNPNWIETLVITGDSVIDPELNVDDDIKRDLYFYNTSFQNAIKGINQLKKVLFKFNQRLKKS